MTFFFSTFSRFCDPCTSIIFLHLVTFTSALDVGGLLPVLWVDPYRVGTSELPTFESVLPVFKDFYLQTIIMFVLHWAYFSHFHPVQPIYYNGLAQFDIPSYFFLFSFLFSILLCDEMYPNRKWNKRNIRYKFNLRQWKSNKVFKTLFSQLGLTLSLWAMCIF